MFSLVIFSEVRMHANHHARYQNKILTLHRLRNVEFENLDQTPEFCPRHRAEKSRRLF